VKDHKAIDPWKGKGTASSALVMPLVIAAIAIMTGVTSVAAQEPFARARIQPDGPVTVGQPVELVVEVFVSTWFSRAPQFPIIEIESAIATPPGRSSNLNEQIKGQRYFGLTRSYTIYPQVPGDYEVFPIAVTVTPGLADASVIVRTPPLTFRARIPQEARSLDYFIGANQLTVSQSVEPKKKSFKVGDAITRTVTTTVHDALSLVLPPLTFDRLSGLAVYPSNPIVTDEGGERDSGIIGRRIDAATYVMQEEGDYELPAIEVVWWDLKQRRIQRSTAAAIAFHVAPNPAYAVEFALLEEPDSVVEEDLLAGNVHQWRPWMFTIGALVLVAMLFGLKRRYGSRVVAWYQEVHRQKLQSESYHFSSFRKACQNNEPREAMRCLLTWLEQISSPGRTATVSWLVRETSDGDLSAAVLELEGRLYGPAPPEEAWNGDALYQSVNRQRKRLLSSYSIQRTPTILQPLNPSTRVSG